MSNYYLFLDESKPSGNLLYFCLGGYIIEENEYVQKMIPLVNSLKNEIFNNTTVVLHESEIRDPEKPPYDILKDFEKKKGFWNGLRNIIDSCNITTIGVGINPIEYKKLYCEKYANNDYFVALQIILENFVHFLEHNEGKGIIYIESRTPTDDTRLASHYHTIVANGTLFFNKVIFQKRLTTINFSMKQDDNVGLQIADFIPNPLNRACSYNYDIKKQKKPNVFDLIDSKLYNGNCNLKERFGLKIIT